MGYYVPSLGTTLIPIKHHMKFRGNYFHAENNKVSLAYDSDILYLNCDTEFTLKVKEATNSTKQYIFDECLAQKISTITNGKKMVTN